MTPPQRIHISLVRSHAHECPLFSISATPLRFQFHLQGSPTSKIPLSFSGVPTLRLVFYSFSPQPLRLIFLFLSLESDSKTPAFLFSYKCVKTWLASSVTLRKLTSCGKIDFVDTTRWQCRVVNVMNLTHYPSVVVCSISWALHSHGAIWIIQQSDAIC